MAHESAAAQAEAPPMPVVRDTLWRSPNLIPVVGQRYTLGWQDAKKQGPCFMVARTGAMGNKILDRFPLTEDGWAPQSYVLDTEYPFVLEIPAQAWTAHLLALADGSHTSAELLDLLKAQGAVHANTPAPEFAQVIAQLISGGFLELT